MAPLGLLTLCLLLVPGAASPGGSLMRRERPKRTQSALQVALEKVLSGEAAQRLFAVEASIRPSYEAFPKNAQGQIPMQEIFPAIVRNYFAKEHGWLIRGLEPLAMDPNMTEVHDAAILRERAPEVADALQAIRRSGHGLSLSDLVGAIAALEHLVIEESVGTLRSAYALNELSPEGEIGVDPLHEVLQSYLLLFRYGSHFNLSDAEAHRTMKVRAKKATDWPSMLEFEQGAVTASGINAEPGSTFSFPTVARVVREMAQKYGKWQNTECVDMKATLMGLVAKNGSGHVPFEAFHAEPVHAAYQFTETVEYLRQMGMVQEAEDGGDHPEVRVANYVLGPTNCIAPSKYHSVCCLNECEGVISDIESRSQAPVLAVEQLLRVVSETPSATEVAPRDFTQAVADQLRTVGVNHEGLVALHSADFKKWLHSAFPNECPFPTAREQEAEESEMRAASAFLAAQHDCTRLPEWHPASPSALSELLEV